MFLKYWFLTEIMYDREIQSSLVWYCMIHVHCTMYNTLYVYFPSVFQMSMTTNVIEFNGKIWPSCYCLQMLEVFSMLYRFLHRSWVEHINKDVHCTWLFLLKVTWVIHHYTSVSYLKLIIWSYVYTRLSLSSYFIF